jgi:hypothetical protein
VISPLEDSMSLRASFHSFAPVSALFAALAVFGSGCGGCNDPSITCDENGENCVICDGYGCNPADTGSSSGNGNATSGAGGSTTGSGGSGGSGGVVDTCDDALTTCPCEVNDDCSEEGTQCVNGLCIDGCEFTFECGPGNVCANGACVAGCDVDVPCDVGYACTNGACAPDPLNPECSDALPCAGEELCVNGLCTTTCATNDECAEGEICDSAAGSCVTDPSPQPLCDDVVVCTGQGQQCMADGYCHYPCADVMTCKLIDVRFVACDTGFCKTEEEVNPECTVNDPCPEEGQDCISNECL